jgi:hypothetical protein
VCSIPDAVSGRFASLEGKGVRTENHGLAEAGSNIWLVGELPIQMIETAKLAVRMQRKTRQKTS